jgi:DNA-binding response OmpR family regulator
MMIASRPSPGPAMARAHPSPSGDAVHRPGHDGGAMLRAAGVPQPAAGGGPSVLVAEDEPMVYETLQAALERKGYMVRLAVTTGEALDLLRLHCFDLVVSDYYMPGGGGHDVLRAVQELAARPKIIMTTGMGSADLVGDLLDAGADLCLTKPFGVREFLDAVGEVLAG